MPCALHLAPYALRLAPYTLRLISGVLFAIIIDNVYFPNIIYIYNMEEIMKNLLIFIFFLVISVSAFALSNNDIQITFNETPLNLVLSKAISSDSIDDTVVHFFDSSFSFEANYKLLFMKIPIKFTGNMNADKGDIFINISAYYQSGEKKDKDTAISRIKSIVKSLNKATNNGDSDVNISAEYIPSNNYCGTIRLNLSNYSVMPALSDVKINFIKLEKDFFTISTTDRIEQNNKAEIQTYVGDGIINALLEHFTEPTRAVNIKIEKIKLSSKGDNTGIITFKYQNSPQSCSWLKLDISPFIKLLNKVDMNVNSYESDVDIDIDSEIQTLISLLNHNIQNYNSKIAGKKMEFVYSNKTVSFEAHFDDIIPMKIQPDIFAVKNFEGVIGVFAQVTGQ